MRIIATRTDATWGLIDEAEFISTDEALKSIFLEFGWAKPYDDTLPLPPKGLNDYEPGLSYPPNRYIIMDQHIYKSNTQTSPAWNILEWDLKV